MNNYSNSVFKSFFIYKILVHQKIFEKSKQIRKIQKFYKKFFWGFKIRTSYLGVNNPSHLTSWNLKILVKSIFSLKIWMNSQRGLFAIVFVSHDPPTRDPAGMTARVRRASLVCTFRAECVCGRFTEPAQSGWVWKFCSKEFWILSYQPTWLSKLIDKSVNLLSQVL